MISAMSATIRHRHVQLEEEAIELRLGQRIGALHLDRVLGRETEERHVERMGDAEHGDAALLHRFEKRRLRPRRRAIDFVGEHDVREDRSPLEDELALPAGVSTRMFVPVTSAGIRSGVHCTRANRRSAASLSVLMSSVLPRPGGPSMSACP